MPKTYLNDRGEPIPAGAPAYLGADGEPAADPTASTPHELNLHTPQKITEPTTYAGGFWQGLKDYGKDLISDPTTMAGVGSGIALATTPVTGPWGLAAAGALGAAGGAGGAHIVKQLRSGPETATGVLGSMAAQGAVGGAMTAVPPLAGKAGRYLVDRAGRLMAPEAEGAVGKLAHAALRRHVPATIAGTVGGWLGGHEGAAMASGAVEAAQSPLVNRTAGRVLEGVGEIPDAMKSLLGRVTGSGRAAALEDAAAARQATFRQGMTPAEPMTPWSPFSTAADRAGPAVAADDAAMTPWSSGFGDSSGGAAVENVAARDPVPYGPGEAAAPRYRSQAGRAIPTTAELDAEFPVGTGADYDPLMAGKRRMMEERWGIRPESSGPPDALTAGLRRGRYEPPPSLAALESGEAAPAVAEAFAPTADDLERSAFNTTFKQQLMDSLARAR